MSSDPFSDFQSAASITPAPRGPGKTLSVPGDLPGPDDALTSSASASASTTASTAKAAKPKATKKTAKPARKRNQRAERPVMTVEEGIAKGLPSKELDALVKEWTRFTLQEAREQAKAAAEQMAKAAEAGRRKIADELLRLADGYGCSMEEAKEIYKEALAAKFDSKVKGK